MNRNILQIIRPRRPISLSFARFQVLLLASVLLSADSFGAPAHADPSASKGIKLLRQGKIDAAINEFEASLQRNPNDLDSLLGMAAVLKGSKRADRAEQYLRRAHKLSPENEQAMSMLIEVLSWDKRTRKESVSLLINYTKKHPTDMKARRELVKLTSADKATFDIAVEQLKYIVERDPNDFESALHLARLRNWTPHWKESEKYFQIYLERRPDDFQVREEFADLLAFQKKDSAKAAEQYKIVLKHKPKNLDARIKLTNMLEASNKFAEAFTELKTLQTIDPAVKLKRYDSAGKEIMVPIGLAQAEFSNWKLKDYGLSKQLYLAFIKEHPQEANAYVRLKFSELLLHRLADRSGAIDQIDQVLKRDPGNVEALETKAKLYMYAQQFKLAESAIRQLLHHHPSAKLEVFVDSKWQSKPAAIALATMIHLQGRYDQADEILATYLRNHPGDGTISRLAKVWQSITPGVAPMDPIALDQYLEKHPQDIDKRIEKISYLLGHNDLDAALQQLRLVQSQKPETNLDLYLLGQMRKVNVSVAIAQTLFRMKNIDEGKSIFSDYLAKHPDDDHARFEYAELLSHLGKDEKNESLSHFHKLSNQNDQLASPTVTGKATIHHAILLSELGNHKEANRVIDQLLLTDPHAPYLDQGEGERMTPALAKALILLFANEPAQAEGVIKHYYPNYNDSENHVVLSLLAQSVGRQKGREREGLGLIDIAQSKKNDPVLHQVKADLLATIGKTEESIKLYEELLAQSKNVDPWLAVRLAEVLTKANRPNDAKQVLKKYGAISDAEGRQHLIADSLIDLGEYQHGISIYENMLNNTPNLTPSQKASILLGLAYGYSKLDQTEKAESYAIEAAGMAPPEVLKNRVGQFFNHAKSRAILAKALYTLLKNEPENTYYLKQIAELELWHLNERDKGIEHLAKYVAMKPEDLESKLELANVYNYANQSKKSLKLFKELSVDKPDDPDVILGLASAQMNVRSEVKNSISNFQRYFALKPDDMSAKVLMVFAMTNAGKRGEALQMLYALRKQKPDDARLLLVLARTELEVSTTRETGIQHLREYLQIKPNDRDAKRSLAESLSWSNRRKEALAIFAQLASDAPTDTDLRISHASLLSRSGKEKIAIAHIHKILQSDPENKRALLALADVYASNQDYFKAESYLKKARSLYPEDPVVALDSARNFKSIGRYDKALAEIKKLKLIQSKSDNI
ncbi:MAG: tetratricopeptide repeat protein [Candidatus Melainabacteria bacterium]|nr:tetratricopeptide repeat protein [Candidatus Melainabacteria bacterium]